MPLSYQVNQLRGGSAELTFDASSSSPSFRKSWSTKWEVLFSGAANPLEIDEIYAGSVDGLPVLAQSVYQSAVTGLIYPYLIATSKSVSRDETNAYRFIVDVSYDDPSGDSEASAVPTDPEELEPRITWAVSSGTETAWSEADSVRSSEPRKAVLPTGTLYASPPTRRSTIFTATVQQYENSFSLAKLEQRMGLCNKDTWMGFESYQAIIDDIKWEYVKIPIVGDTFQYSYKITYTIVCKKYKVKHLKDDGSVATKTVGWETVRIRSDNMFNTVPDDPTSRILYTPKNAAAVGDVYRKEDGTPHPVALQNGTPPMDFLRTEEEGNFKSTSSGGFLRVY